MPHKVTSVDDLDEVLKKCASVKAVHVVEIPVDYSASERSLQAYPHPPRTYIRSAHATSLVEGFSLDLFWLVGG